MLKTHTRLNAFFVVFLAVSAFNADDVVAMPLFERINQKIINECGLEIVKTAKDFYDENKVFVNVLAACGATLTGSYGIAHLVDVLRSGFWVGQNIERVEPITPVLQQNPTPKNILKQDFMNIHNKVANNFLSQEKIGSVRSSGITAMRDKTLSGVSWLGYNQLLYASSSWDQPGRAEIFSCEPPDLEMIFCNIITHLMVDCISNGISSEVIENNNRSVAYRTPDASCCLIRRSNTAKNDYIEDRLKDFKNSSNDRIDGVRPILEKEANSIMAYRIAINDMNKAAVLKYLFNSINPSPHKEATHFVVLDHGAVLGFQSVLLARDGNAIEFQLSARES